MLGVLDEKGWPSLSATGGHWTWLSWTPWGGVEGEKVVWWLSDAFVHLLDVCVCVFVLYRSVDWTLWASRMTQSNCEGWLPTLPLLPPFPFFLSESVCLFSHLLIAIVIHHLFSGRSDALWQLFGCEAACNLQWRREIKTDHDVKTEEDERRTSVQFWVCDETNFFGSPYLFLLKYFF